MKFLKTIFIVVTLVFLAGAAHGAEKSYTFALPIVKDLSGTSITDLMTGALEVLSKKTGLDLKPLTIPYDEHSIFGSEITLEALKENKAQMGYVDAMEYAELLDKYPEQFRPEFTLTIDEKKYEELCMYVAKDSAVREVEETRGLVWGGSDTIGARLILHENEIDEPLASFFKKVEYISTLPLAKVVEALVNGEIDVFMESKGMLKLGGKVESSKAGKKKPDGPPYKEIYCTDYKHNWLFGYRYDVPLEVSLEITGIMTKAHKNKDFAQFHFMFLATTGKFVPFEKKEFERTLEIIKLKNSLGWDKERKEHFKKAKSAP